MASITANTVVAPSVGIASSASTSRAAGPARAQLGAPTLPRTSLVAKPTGFSSKTVSNGSRTNAFLVVDPLHNHKFETLSYLPQLTEEQILKQVEYIIRNGWIPAIEFDTKGIIFREGSTMPGYYDGRYWVMWKLPLFGANAPEQVLSEVQLCKKEYPGAFIRVIAFDNVRQVQVIGFIVAKPEGYKE